MSINKLIKGNVRFANEFHKNKKLYLDLVENGQHPKVLWVGCSDSRVIPEFTVKEFHKALKEYTRRGRTYGQ